MKDIFTVNILGEITGKVVHCESGDNLYSILTENGFEFTAPCGGKGICGKCLVKILSGKTNPVTEYEKSYLSEQQLSEGWRLSCHVKVYSDITVELPQAGKALVVTSGIYKAISGDPLISKQHISLDPPSLSDQRSILTRLYDALPKGNRRISLDLIRKLPQITKESDCKITVVYDKEDIIAIEPGDSPLRSYGVAIDIGTTTIAAYLIDLQSGSILATKGEVNAQSRFGADVISRIGYTIEQEKGTATMNKLIINQIDGIISSLASQNNINSNEIYGICIVGNTTMQHFVQGLDASSIASAPFAPANTLSYSTNAKNLGFNSTNAKCYLLPCVSAYIGSDITAGILSTEIYQRDELSLLVDIGTNGEIVLGNKHGLYACSTAAGPAFEGANIKHGVAGVTGAIDSVKIINGNISYTTIENSTPCGICGSGVLDIVAQMLENDIIDETGRMETASEITIAQGTYKNITFTAQDVREVQLAKAAIAAGINVMLKRMKKTENDIETVYLAGGFGSHMNKNSAIRIGLLSDKFYDKINAVGNSAGSGAIMALLSQKEMDKCLKIASDIHYIELSSSADFTMEFTECMIF